MFQSSIKLYKLLSVDQQVNNVQTDLQPSLLSDLSAYKDTCAILSNYFVGSVFGGLIIVY